MSTGDAVYVIVSDAWYRPGGAGGLLRYVVAEDRWEHLPPPAADLSGYRLTRAGDAIVAYVGSADGGEPRDAIFDPASGTWSDIPVDPLAPSFDRSMVAVDGQLYLFGRDLVPNPGSEQPSLTRVARFDPATRRWEARADTAILGTWPPVASGSRIVIPLLGEADGGEVNNWGRSYPYGGIYDTPTDTWSPLPPVGPDEPMSAAGVIDQQSAFYITERGAVLHAPDETWLPIPDLPATGGDVTGRTIVNADRALFVFGGESWTETGGELLDTAHAWQPGS